MNVKNKVAIVTGASSGIGLATAKLLTNHGAKVALAARSKEKLSSLSKELALSFPIQTDMTKEASIRQMVKKAHDHYGRIDILINNAGRGYDAFLEKIKIDKFRELFELNLLGPIIAMQQVIPIMRKQGGGVIINISSGTSMMQIPNISAYSSLKRALNGISLTAREELARDKIIVSIVYPYITATNFAKNIMGGERVGQPQARDSNLPPADPPALVAEKILEVIKTEKAEQFVHDWMENFGTMIL